VEQDENHDIGPVGRVGKKLNRKALFNSFESPRSGYSFEVNGMLHSGKVSTKLQDLMV